MNEEEVPKVFEKEKNPDEEIREKLEKDGWQRAGNEVTHMTPFNSETGKFDPKEVKRSEVIEREYVDKYKIHCFTEVKLVRPHIWKDGLGYVEDQNSYDIFMRKSEDIK